MSIHATSAPASANASAVGQNVTKRTWIFGSEIELGGFWPALSTEIRLDSADGELGGGVEFENDLNFSDRKSLLFMQGAWRISDSWLIQADYVRLDRTASTTLETEIEWPPGEGGEIYPIGAVVGGFLDFGSSRITAAYIFRTSPRSELAVALGIHLTSMSAGIGLAAESGGESGSVEADMELPLIPLPTLGLYWGARMGEKWLFRVRGDYFALKPATSWPREFRQPVSGGPRLLRRRESSGAVSVFIIPYS